MSYTAKSVILDLADNHAGWNIMGLRSVEFKFESSVITTGFTAYATSQYADCDPEYAFDTTKSKTGVDAGNGWCSSIASTNQRLIAVFDSEITFDEVVINNYHYSGGSVSYGVNNLTIDSSTDTITDTTYNAAISNDTRVFQGSIDEHTASDAIDDQILSLGIPFYMSASIPMQTLFFNNIALLDLPSLTLELLPLPYITTTLPTLALEIVSGRQVNFRIEFPPLFLTTTTTQTNTWDEIEIELPSLVLSAHGSGVANISIPILEVELSGNSEKVGAINIALPMFDINSNGGGNADFKLSSLIMELAASLTTPIPARSGDFSILLPMLQSRIHGLETGDVDIEMTLPGLYLFLQAGEITEGALRYIRNKIR